MRKLIACLALLFTTSAHAQMQEPILDHCDRDALIAQCNANSWTCPNLGIPRPQLVEIIDQLPWQMRDNGQRCLGRPLSQELVVTAYRSLWNECVNAYIAERSETLVELAKQARMINSQAATIKKLRSRCGRSCRSVR